MMPAFTSALTGSPCHGNGDRQREYPRNEVVPQVIIFSSGVCPLASPKS